MQPGATTVDQAAEGRPVRLKDGARGLSGPFTSFAAPTFPVSSRRASSMAC